MENSLSTGVDIVLIKRIEDILSSSKRDKFLEKIFSQNEIEDAKKIEANSVQILEFTKQVKNMEKLLIKGGKNLKGKISC